VLPAVHRLHRQQFETVYTQGNRFSSKFLKLRVWTDPTSTAPPKVGIVISKKTAKSSVRRHQIKRQIRAILRSHLPKLNKGLQMIVTVVTVESDPSYWELADDLQHLFTKAQVFEVSNGNSRRSVL
jgi:ribonuclease P protein component